MIEAPDPARRVLEKLQGVKRDPRGWTARCPAHGDAHNSLSIAYREGRVLLKCFAGCEADSIAQSVGLRLADLFAEQRDKPAIAEPPHGVTLAELAQHKRLPEAFLRELGWRDESNGRPFVAIPYPNPDGTIHRLRHRFKLSGTKGSSWPKDDGREGQIAYDPKPELRARDGYLVIVEGETDTATLLYADIPALGCPGAEAHGKIEAHHIEGLRTLFVIQEPDRSGLKFPGNVTERVTELGYTGPIHTLIMPDAAKDPSALFQRDPEGFAARFHALMREAAGPRSLQLAKMIGLALRPRGKRLRTGFDGLDDALRGGIPGGAFTVIAGAPGAAKTTLAVCLADRWERGGASVIYVAADEAPAGIVVRMGQLAGYSRDGLEDDGTIGDSIRAGYQRTALERRFYLSDPDTGATLEAAIADLDKLPKDAPRILIVDSLQTARCQAAETLTTAMERIDATIMVCQRAARTGAIVVALSEMNRSGYNGSAQTGLASAKGSGKIEYGVDLYATLTNVRGERGQVDMTVEKSRLGPDKAAIRLRLDYARADIAEIDRPEGEPMHNRGGRRPVDPKTHELNVLAACKSGECRSKNEISARVEGNRLNVFAAVDRLMADGRLRLVAGTYRVAVPEQEPGQRGDHDSQT